MQQPSSSSAHLLARAPTLGAASAGVTLAGSGVGTVQPVAGPGASIAARSPHPSTLLPTGASSAMQQRTMIRPGSQMPSSNLVRSSLPQYSHLLGASGANTNVGQVSVQQPVSMQQRLPPQQTAVRAPGSQGYSASYQHYQQRIQNQGVAGPGPSAGGYPQTHPSSMAGQRSTMGPPQVLSRYGAPGNGMPPGNMGGESATASKRKFQDLLTQVDPSFKLDPELENVLADISERFIDTVTSFSCKLAKHRKSTQLTSKDITLQLERKWQMKVPGFSGGDYRKYAKSNVNEVHKQRISAVKLANQTAPPSQAASGPTAVPAGLRSNIAGLSSPRTAIQQPPPVTVPAPGTTPRMSPQIGPVSTGPVASQRLSHGK